MKNNPIQTMIDEHEIISKTEEIISGLNRSWEHNSEKYIIASNILIEFFRDYADGVHHRKEEEILFPAICNHPDFKLTDIIEELEMHHEDFREYTIDIEKALSEKDFEISYKELKKYSQELLDHIAVENDELFVLAETLLGDEDLETIYFKFKDIDMELGYDRKNILEQLLDTI